MRCSIKKELGQSGCMVWVDRERGRVGAKGREVGDEKAGTVA